jgi:predicted ATPase/DNA-binding SARP family transcriptional activator
LRGRKQRGLLALLLLHANEVVSRDRLIDELWSEQPPETAANTLQVHVSQLRKVLAGDGVDAAATLATRSPGYVLQADPDQVDAQRFERLVNSADEARSSGNAAAASAALAEALDLWRGPALADLTQEAFARPEAARLEELRLRAVEDRIECDLALGRHVELAAEVAALVEQHPLRERLREQLMLALYRSGRQADALAAYQDARAKLDEELGIAPSQALNDLQRSILRQDESIAGTHQPPARRARRESLPEFLTPFVGRASEVDAIVELVRRGDVRLVTLTGLGGIGKTRLGVEAARALAADFPDGAIYVPLATISDPNLVAPTMVQALGADEAGHAPEEVLEDHLAARRSLLVVDNFEQVVSAGELFSRLLRAAPEVKLLITSRAPLRLEGEHEYTLPALPVEDSVALFAERAEAVNPAFSMTGATMKSVVELCTRLEGLPLAIELAAARTRLLTPAAMLDRLDRRLDLLAAGPRDVPGRHRALRLTLEWSFDLMTPEQQRVFARLGVFVGAFDIDAAEAVCDAAVLDDLSAVAEESLIRREPGDEARFVMLETVREYAVERLRLLGEEEDARERHAHYFLAFAEEAHAALGGPEQADSLARLERAHDNLRAAQAYIREQRDPELLLRMCAALWRFWQIHGHLDEGRRALEGALAADPDGDPLLRVRAFNGAGVLAAEQGDFEAAESFFEPALVLVRGLEEHERTANVLVNLGNLGLFARDFGRARRLYEESIEYAALSGSAEVEAIARENLGLMALDQGDLPQAVELLEESAALAAQAGDDRGRSSSNRALAAALLESGETDAARERLIQSFELARRLGELNGIAYCLDTFAGLATAEGDPERAARLFGAADGVRASIGALRPPDQQPLYERWVASTLTQLETGTYASCYESGRALGLDEASELALAPPSVRD